MWRMLNKDDAAAELGSCSAIPGFTLPAQQPSEGGRPRSHSSGFPSATIDQ